MTSCTLIYSCLVRQKLFVSFNEVPRDLVICALPLSERKRSATILAAVTSRSVTLHDRLLDLGTFFAST